MKDNWTDALYGRFLLRDVLGKIAPGSVLLFALVVSLTSPKNAYDFILALPSGAWVAAFAAAWLTGIGIQSVGEALEIIRYLPRGITEPVWRKKNAQFRERSDYDRHKQGYERYIVIKEACGNACLALGLSTLWFTVDYLWDNVVISNLLSYVTVLRSIPFYGLDGLMIWSLWRMHRKHADRQYEYLESVLANPRSDGGPMTDRIAIKMILTDSWDEELLKVAGEIAISFAQLEHILWLGPKRIQELSVLDWAEIAETMTIPKRCAQIRDQYAIKHLSQEKEAELDKLLKEVEDINDKRNGLIHAQWGCKKVNGEIVSRHRLWRGDDLGVDVSKLRALRDDIRVLRNKLGKYEW